MARKDWYTVRTGKKDWEVIKFDEDFNPLQTYRIGKEGGNIAVCDCFAGFRYCRHKQMIPLFESLKRIDSGWLYSFDRKRWSPPIGGDEEEIGV